MPKPEGRPAFPIQYDPYVDHPTHGRIHRAAVGEEVNLGMSLRQWYAGKAIVGILSNQGVTLSRASLPGLAEMAFEMADYMIAESEKNDAV